MSYAICPSCGIRTDHPSPQCKWTHAREAGVILDQQREQSQPRRPTHAIDGVELRLAPGHARGDIIRDRLGRAWFWEGNDSKPLLTRAPHADEPFAAVAENAFLARRQKATMGWYLSQLGDA